MITHDHSAVPSADPMWRNEPIWPTRYATRSPTMRGHDHVEHVRRSRRYEPVHGER